MNLIYIEYFYFRSISIDVENGGEKAGEQVELVVTYQVNFLLFNMSRIHG
jgi:hypothetical protein